MPSEFTAGMVIGPLEATSYHGKPCGERRLFCPSHTLMLLEGARATWMVQALPPVGRAKPQGARIRPSSPGPLLASRDFCAPHLYGVLTVLPGTSIG